eukprot:4166635-Pyramimonas_sp.AAC.1
MDCAENTGTERPQLHITARIMNLVRLSAGFAEDLRNDHQHSSSGRAARRGPQRRRGENHS